jgi:hypothetical protein
MTSASMSGIIYGYICLKYIETDQVTSSWVEKVKLLMNNLEMTISAQDGHFRFFTQKYFLSKPRYVHTLLLNS